MKMLKTLVSQLSRKANDYINHVKGYPFISFIFRIIDKIGKDNAGDLAAGIAYYSVLSVFPLLLGGIAMVGLFLPSETVQVNIFNFAEQYLPGSTQLVQNNVSSVIKLRGTLGIISILGLLWTGSAIFSALSRVINIAWGIKTFRPFFKEKARIFLISFSTGIIFLISMAANALGSVIPKVNIQVLDFLSGLTGRAVGFILLFFVFILLFKFLPNARTYWRYIWPGALLTAAIFEIARSVFIFYLANFAGYNKIYGSLAAVIILLVWIYFSAFIFIIGTEFTSEYSRVRLKPKTS